MNTRYATMVMTRRCCYGTTCAEAPACSGNEFAGVEGIPAQKHFQIVSSVAVLAASVKCTFNQ